MSAVNVLETDWWTLIVPPQWWAEADEEVIVVGDEDGVGAIEISTLQRDESTADVLGAAEIAAQESPEVTAWELVSCGDFSGVCGTLQEEGTALREWYLGSEQLLLYVTYACELDNAGLDDAAVDEILDTLALRQAD